MSKLINESFCYAKLDNSTVFKYLDGFFVVVFFQYIVQEGRCEGDYDQPNVHRVIEGKYW